MDTNIQTAQSEIRKNIITLLDIDKLPEEKQEETISRIGNIIFQSVLIRVLPLLEETDLAQYENLVEAGTEPDTLIGFFFEKVPSFLDIVIEEANNFKNESGELLENIK